MTPPLSTPAAPRRLLVRGVNWLGDAVMTTPALLRLREALPGTHVTLLTHEKLTGLWAGHPAVDDVLPFGSAENVFQIAQRLRRASFDTALILPNSIRSALEARLAGIPRRIGYAGSWRNWLLTRAVPLRSDVVKMRKRTPEEVRRLVAEADRGRGLRPLEGSSHDQLANGVTPLVPASSHHLFHYLHLAAAFGARPEPLAPFVAVSAADVLAVKAKFNLPEGLLIGLNAGAEYGPAKRWPAEHFIATAQQLRARLKCAFVIFGGPADSELASRIASALAPPSEPRASATSVVSNLAGRTSLRELCAAMRACRVVLTNDTGPMHVAAAVGARVVGLFGSTSIELTGPGLPGDARNLLLRGTAPCAPCFLRECPVDFRCMKDLTVERVSAAVEQAATHPA